MTSIHIYAPLCIAAGAIFPPLCTTLVVLRFLGRKTQKLHIGLDDWLTIPPLLFMVGMCTALLYGTSRHAIGYPSPPPPPGKTILTVQDYAQSTLRSVFWSIEVMQIPALGCIKSSLLLFYKRLFYTGTSRALRSAINLALVITLAWTIAFFFTVLLMCHRRFDAFWTTLRLEKEYCLDTVKIHNAFGISDVIIDLMVILLPVPMVWPLKMSWDKKLGVLGLFLLGALSIVASMFRMVTYLESTKVEFSAGTNTGILITGALYWGLVECGLALICCCLPAVHGAYKQPVYRTMSWVSSMGMQRSQSSSCPHSRRRSIRIPRGPQDIYEEELEFRYMSNAEAASSHPESIDQKIHIDTVEAVRELQRF